MPIITNGKLGSSPIKLAQTTRPAAKEKMPAMTTGAAPKRAISRPANNSDVIGTSSGPGEIASPVCSADQPHAVCPHNATDSSIAPNAAE